MSDPASISVPHIWDTAQAAQEANFRSVHHGIEHWVRVERNVLWLADQVEGVDLLVARLFAALHDCQRRDDGYDREHGPRAADFIAGLELPLAAQRLETLVTAVRTHTFGPTESDDLTIQVCHDADRLDLGRVAIRPNPAFLNTAPARDLAARDAVRELDGLTLPVTKPELLTPTPHWRG